MMKNDPVEYVDLPNANIVNGYMRVFRKSWKEGLQMLTLAELEEKRDWWEECILTFPSNAKEDAKILEELDARIDVLRDRLIKAGERENPLAFCIPTYDQAQFLNAWSPDYEPDKAPDGYNSVVNFGGKRSLKSTALGLNTILWMVPNDPQWAIFREHTDKKGRKYQVKRRPVFNVWRRKKTMVFDADEPPVQDRNFWIGCVDEVHWKTKIEKELRRWMPMQYIKRTADGSAYVWSQSDRYFETKWGCRTTGMLYKSDIQAWGGQELFMVSFDEGPPRPVVDEVVARSIYIGWAYTPAEAANTSDRVQVARGVYEGKIALVGATKIIKSDMRDVPDAIIPSEVLARRVATLETMGEAGRVAMAGGFFDSSPRVFDLFVRERHVLPVTGEQIRRWVKAEWTPEEIKRFPWCVKFEDANIIRGFDEGFVHDTACVWNALLRSGEQVIFREFAETATSINERVEKIIKASGNERKEIPRVFSQREQDEMEIALTYGPDIQADREREKATGEQVRRFREVQKSELIRTTLADSKMFKRDPKYLMDTWGTNYTRQGLKVVRASTLLPDQRCSYTNGLFRANPSRQHLNPAQATDEYPNGYDLYVTCDCEKVISSLERYLWETFTAGNRKGDPTGKPGLKDDDVPDALCYATNHQMRWKPNSEIRMSRE